MRQSLLRKLPAALAATLVLGLILVPAAMGLGLDLDVGVEIGGDALLNVGAGGSANAGADATVNGQIGNDAQGTTTTSVTGTAGGSGHAGFATGSGGNGEDQSSDPNYIGFNVSTPDSVGVYVTGEESAAGSEYGDDDEATDEEANAETQANIKINAAMDDMGCLMAGIDHLSSATSSALVAMTTGEWVNTSADAKATADTEHGQVVITSSMSAAAGEDD